MKTIIRNVCAAALLCAARLAASPVLMIDPPGGAVSGDPGSTVNWGFTITQDDQYWLVISAVQLATDPAPVGTIANFQDYFSFWVSNNSFALAPATVLPGSPLTTAATGSWLAGFSIPSSATPGQVTSPLTILVDYDLFDADPFSDPNASQVTFGEEISGTAQITVTGVGEVPEPGPVTLMLSGIALLWGVRRISIQSRKKRTVR